MATYNSANPRPAPDAKYFETIQKLIDEARAANPQETQETAAKRALAAQQRAAATGPPPATPANTDAETGTPPTDPATGEHPTTHLTPEMAAGSKEASDG